MGSFLFIFQKKWLKALYYTVLCSSCTKTVKPNFTTILVNFSQGFFMTRPKTVIQQKITELTKQVAHFEQCIQTAKQHIRTLESALIALQSEPFQPPKNKPKENKKRPKETAFVSTITVYSYRPSEFIAKVFKRFPNEWLSTTEIMWKTFEIEGETPDKVHHHSIVISFSHALRRLEAKGIVEKQLEGDSKTLWKLADIESLSNHVEMFGGK